MGIDIKVDKEKCIHCGLCVKDCMSEIITFDDEKFLQAQFPNTKADR